MAQVERDRWSGSLCVTSKSGEFPFEVVEKDGSWLGWHPTLAAKDRNAARMGRPKILVSHPFRDETAKWMGHGALESWFPTHFAMKLRMDGAPGIHEG
jgi:hypothetical protein